jgi:Tfp pilus assembly protein PilF
MSDHTTRRYREIVESLSGSVDFALAGYRGMLRLDRQSSQDHLFGEIEDHDYDRIRNIEKQLADIWLQAAESLLLVIKVEKLFDGDERIARLQHQITELRSQITNLHC